MWLDPHLKEEVCATHLINVNTFWRKGAAFNMFSGMAHGTYTVPSLGRAHLLALDYPV